MGFCLFEHAISPGIYFAVNSAHVLDVSPKAAMKDGRQTAHIDFSFKLRDFDPIAVGAPEDVERLLRDGARIGLKKANLNVVSGKRLTPAPLLLNKPGRVALVRELRLENISEDATYITLSEMIEEDGKTRMITERPGVFTFRVNAGDQVPRLDSDD